MAKIVVEIVNFEVEMEKDDTKHGCLSIGRKQT